LGGWFLSSRIHNTAILLVLLMLAPSITMVFSYANQNSSLDNSSTDASTFTSPIPQPPILVDGLPPLYCSQTEICPTPVRLPDIPVDSWSHEDHQWWFRYGPDLDWNGMDDRLQYILADVYPSQSPTAIIGDDGELTLAIVIDFAWHPEERELAQVREILLNHGWVGEEGGARFFTVGEIDSIIVDKVPQSALMDIYHLQGVVVIEQQNVMVPSMAVAAKAIKARSSENYTSGADMSGIRGDGVVIAILDSGVDNEHRSLNDFDDLNDDPDADANSYDDQKWLAGFDSTDSLNSQTTDGSVDPDDTAGHGSHVAGIALGTGDASRNHIGIAPGAYLVDVKVFTDIGRSNSQYTIAGMNWTINNKNTDWGNNASSNGIDIMSMSFGRARSPIGGQDTGDNGSDAEARLVNDAWDAGIVPVCAMGNDGANYVASPASADRCIAVAASDDHDTVIRTDDTVADYSNYGPRQDDGDGDSWDELKPDVIAPGTDISSVQHAASGPIGGTVLADDSYTEMSGTSMSTPVVAGLCALILEANPHFEPADVKAALQNNSEFIVDEIVSINGQSWNASEGFGRVDAIMALGGGGSGGRWVDLHLPNNGTWMNVGDTYRLRGNASIPAVDIIDSNTSIESVKVSARYTYWTWKSIPPSQPGYPGKWELNNRTAFSWSNASGVDNWTFDFTPELWHDGAGLYMEVRALDNLGRWSQPAWAEYRIGETTLTLIEPSGHGSVSGDVELKGEYKAVYGQRIEYRIGSAGDWKLATDNIEYPYVCLNPNVDDCDSKEWSATWDSTEVYDGGWVLYIRLVSDNGIISDPIDRYLNVDNIPAAPDLEPVSEIVISENGIPLSDAFVNSFLNAEVTIRNSGDAHARNFDVILLDDGSQVAVQTVSKLDSTKTLALNLGFHPTTEGSHNLEVVIDPGDQEVESREDNNVASTSFTINNRPSGVDLAIREGAAITKPSVSNPNGDVTLQVRVENLAGDGSSGATFSLEKWSDLGWESLESGRSLNIVPGAGFVDVPFTLHEGTLDPGLVKFRATVSLEGGQDLNPDNNQLEFTLLVDEAQLQGARSLDLPGGHEVLGFFGLRGENLMFTGEGSSLWVHRINAQYDLITCLELEIDWAGEFSIDNGESDSAYVSWTRRYTDQFGVTLSTLSFSSIDLSCTASEKFDLLPALMLAEGTYWGIDLSVDGGEVLIGGYHRDLFTGGTYDDETSVFLLAAASPLDRESWNLTEDVVDNLVPPTNREGSVKVAHGDDWTHITYQANRDDETGIERVGTFYAHGRLGTGNWSFRIAVGDQTTISELAVLANEKDDADVIVMAWREGTGQDATLVVIRADSSMQTQDVVHLPAPGMGMIQFVETKRGIQMFHDAVGPSGRQIVYSIIEANQTVIGTPIGEGELMNAGRSDIAGETHLFYLSATQDWRARMLIDDSAIEAPNNGILDTIRIWTGLDASTFALAVRILAVALAVGCLLIFLASAGIITHRRRKGPALTVEIEDDEEVIDVDEDHVSLIEEDEAKEIDSSDKFETEDIDDESAPESLEEPSKNDVIDDENPEQEDGMTRRQKRRQERLKGAEPDIEELPSPPPLSALDGELPPPPSPMELGTLPPPPGIDVTCECGANFRVKSIELKHVQCPVCAERIKL